MNNLIKVSQFYILKDLVQRGHGLHEQVFESAVSEKLCVYVIKIGLDGYGYIYNKFKPYIMEYKENGYINFGHCAWHESWVFFKSKDIYEVEANHPELGLGKVKVTSLAELRYMFASQENKSLRQEIANLKAEKEKLENELVEASAHGQGNKTLLRFLKLFAKAEDVVKVQEEFNKLGVESNFSGKYGKKNELFGLTNRQLFEYYKAVMSVEERDGKDKRK